LNPKAFAVHARREQTPATATHGHRRFKSKGSLKMNFATSTLNRNPARIVKRRVLGTLSATPLLVAILSASATTTAYAADAQTAQSPVVEEIVVTGSRVVRDGYQAPTPVSVVSVEEMQNTATSNLADYVNTLPSLAGSSTPQSTATLVTTGQGAINGLNLRGLGTVRTLVLLNGQRTVGGIVTGVVDVSELPQQLINRVDVVTGGASAAYGSDALTGVVNFVLDTKYVGFKGEVSGGVTTYGDNRNWKVSATNGSVFGNDRGHFLISGEASAEDGIAVNNRPWNSRGDGYMTNPAYGTGPGQSTSVPLQIQVTQLGLSNAGFGGVIANGPLRGTAFGPGGAPYQITYGSLVTDPLMSGGSWQSQTVKNVGGAALQPIQSRQNVFTRASYQITDDIEVYGQAAWGHLKSISRSVPVFYVGSLTIKADNAFLPASVASQVTALKLTSFLFGTMNGDIGTQRPEYDRRSLRFLIGADGKFDAFDTRWKWDGYLSSGFTMSRTTSANTIMVPRYMAAIDAVRNPNGAIVCRVNADAIATNDDPLCSPLNLFGRGVASQASLDYVKANPWNVNRLLQKVAAVSVNGEPFSTWAGPVSLATGIEHREESTRAIADPFEAVTGTWFLAAGIPFSGKFTVTEGFVETVVPLAKDTAWAKSFDVNGAVRVTGYSTFGNVATWKVGVSYSPFDDLRFRGTRSRDIREPTLVDLFSAGTTQQNAITDPFNGNATTAYRGTTSGNPNLLPEKAISTGLGVVYQPNWFPRFNVSFDYYHINLKGAITTFSAQQLINLCYAGNNTACGTFTRGTQGGLPLLQFFQGPQNFSTEIAKGFDIEASYLLPLDTVNDSWAGNLGIRALATHYISDYLDSGAVGSIPIEQAGMNSGGSPPKWRFEGAINYVLDPVSITLTMRGVSAGVVNSNFIQCTSGCPASTTNRITVSNNHIDGATYFDLNTAYKIHMGDTAQSELFLSVRNVMNKDAALVPIGPGNTSYDFHDTNTQLYDVLGRVFRAGIRFKM
jgi:iron complex outermembrane receptor protein